MLTAADMTFGGRKIVRRRLAVVTAAVALLVAGCAGGSGDSSGDGSDGEEQATKTYSEHGIAFDYPDGWEEFPAEAAATSTGSNEVWSTTIGPDRTNLVNVTAYQLNLEVTSANLEDIETELDDVIQSVVDQAGGTITSGPIGSEIASYPAYVYEWEGVEVDGEPKDSSAYFVFVNDTEYFFNCQFSDEAAGEVREGCDLILDTFEVTSEA